MYARREEVERRSMNKSLSVQAMNTGRFAIKSREMRCPMKDIHLVFGQE